MSTNSANPQPSSPLPSALPSADATAHSPTPEILNEGGDELLRDLPHLIDEDADYPPATEDQLLPPPHFNPFFTLIEDTATGETAHPAVHYIFADDDPELQTAVSMRALGATRHVHPHLDTSAGHATHEEPESISSILPPPRPGIKERYILLDLAPDGQSVAEAQSLSKDWQVIRTQVGPAPTFAGDAGAGQSGNLMLRVDGMEIKKGRPGEEERLIEEARRNAGGDLVRGMEDVLKRFHSGMEILANVVGDDLDDFEADDA